MVQRPLLGQVPLIITVSRSHADTPLSVGLFWTSDQPDAQTPLPGKKQHSEETDIHGPPPAKFEPAIPKSQRPQTLSSDSVATGIGLDLPYPH